MKNLFVIATILFFFSGIQFTNAQDRTPKIMDIPSFGVVVEGQAYFQEFSSPNLTRERRNLLVQTSTASHGMTSGSVQVWIVLVKTQTVVGHYYMNADDKLSVTVDNEQYGVIMKSENVIVTDVYFEGANETL